MTCAVVCRDIHVYNVYVCHVFVMMIMMHGQELLTYYNSKALMEWQVA